MTSSKPARSSGKSRTSQPTAKPTAKPAHRATPPASLILQGERHRKTLPRTGLARWDASLRKRTPEALLHQSMRGRLPEYLAVKRDRMSASAFSFFRGAAPVMAYDLALQPHTGILTQLCGDAHVQNLGAFCGIGNALIFDINDFDETIRGPFEWDVKRMAASILLAAQSANIKRSAAADAAALFLDHYSAMVSHLALLPILEVARFQVHRLASIKPIASILLKAERQSPLLSLDRLTEPTAHGRAFKTLPIPGAKPSAPPLLRPVTGVEATRILASLPAYIATLPPDRRHVMAQFRPVAVGFKVVGTGSVGLRDYCVLLEGNGAADPLFLQIKQEVRSAWAPYLPDAAVFRNQGQRVVDGQRAMQFQSDPLLGWTSIAGRDYLVRQLNDHKASVDMTTLKASGLEAYAEVCGEILARAHSRSGDARVIAGYIGKGNRFKQAICDFADAYAAQTVADWKTYTS